MRKESLEETLDAHPSGRAGRPARALLGDAEPTEPDLAHLVRQALHRPGARIVDWHVEPVSYDIVSPLTAGLFRVRGHAADPTWTGPWSLFVKLVRSWRHWPMLPVIPPDIRAALLQHEGWKAEPDIYRSDLAAALPDGLRMPRVLRVDDLGDERFALWLEDVSADGGVWDIPRFERAARLLGHLTARLTAGDLLPSTVPRDEGVTTRNFYASRLAAYALPLLHSDATWANHVVAAAADATLRDDLGELANRLPAMLDRLDRVPHGLAHGDACPQNLLVSDDNLDGPALATSFVVIDWGMACNAPVGYELAQLLIGFAHSGQLSVEKLPAIHEAILGAYVDGLAEEGMKVDEKEVRYAFDAGLVIRSAFTALPLEQLSGPPGNGLAALIAERVRLTRYLVDLGLAMPRDV